MPRSRRFVGETTVEQYLREKVRTSIEILSDEKLLTLLTVKVTAEGIPGESLSRGLPGMSKEKHLKTPKELGKLKRIDPDLAERLEFLLAGYHRAHLAGPGFGGEFLRRHHVGS